MHYHFYGSNKFSCYHARMADTLCNLNLLMNGLKTHGYGEAFCKELFIKHLWKESPVSDGLNFNPEFDCDAGTFLS